MAIPPHFSAAGEFVVGRKIILDPPHLGYTLRGDYMLAKIQKWGNSQGLRLTKNLLEDAQLDVGGS